MLISIMTDIYTKVTQNRRQSAIKEKVQFMNDFKQLLVMLDLDLYAQYLFEIRPVSDDLTEELIEQKIDRI